MSRTKRPAIPAVPSGTPQQLRPLLESMRQALQIYGDAGRGDPLDAAVTYRDLLGTKAFMLDKGRLSLSTGGSTSGGTIDPTAETLPDVVEAPTKPSGVKVTGTFENLLISWSVPSYKGHLQTRIYIQQVADEDATPNFDSALLIGATTASVYGHTSINTTGFRVWLKHENKNGVLSDLHDPLGTYGEVYASPTEQLADALARVEQLEAEREERTWLNVLSNRAKAIEDKQIIIAQLQDGDASVLLTATAYTDSEVGSLAQQVTAVETANAAVETRMTAAESNITTAQNTADGAQADADSILAEYEIKTTVGQLTASIGIVNNGATSQVYVNADEFYVRKPGMTSKKVFYVANGQLYVNYLVVDQAYINFLVANQITADYINALELTAVKITGGTINIGGGNFTVDASGNVIANSGTFNGTVRANKIQGDVYNSVAVPIKTLEIYGPDAGGSSLVASLGRFSINVAESFRRWCRLPRLFFGGERVGSAVPPAGQQIEGRVYVNLVGSITGVSYNATYELGTSSEYNTFSDSRQLYEPTFAIPAGFTGEIQINFQLRGKVNSNIDNSILTSSDRAWLIPLGVFYKDTKTTWDWPNQYFIVNLWKESEDIVGVDPATY